MLPNLKAALSEALKTEYRIDVNHIDLTRPPPGKGDFAWCATPTALQLNTSAPVVAHVIASALREIGIISKVESAGPYVNVWLNELFDEATDVIAKKEIAVAHPERIMVEYLSPNTNKPLHLGHVRNGVLGSAVANLLSAVGHTVIRADLVNDRGAHICKSMLAYQLWGNGETPESVGRKSDHFVGDWYVLYSRELQKNASLDDQVKEMLQKWEAGDPDVLALWTRMNDWVYAGFATTNARYGFTFDTMYYESKLYQLGKDIVENGVARGVFTRREDGSVAYPLLAKDFGKDAKGNERTATVLRNDGTSVYLTQDLGTAVRKAEDWNLDRSIYVVASEQDHHFACLFSMLRALGYPWASHCFHLSYGMVELPEGRMKSREGTVVDADDLADEIQKLAAEIIRSKDSTLDEAELLRRADVIGLAAIKFHLLSIGSSKSMVFDPKKSLAFEGDTGPYCLYTLARINSILEKASDVPVHTGPFKCLRSPEERTLACDLVEMSQVIQRAAEKYNPTAVVKHLIAVGRSFNRFYGTHRILGEDADLQSERLALIRATGEALQWGLTLLGITTLKHM